MVKELIRFIEKVIYGLAVLGGCSVFSCEESLPPRDLRDFLSSVFRAPETADVFFVVENDTILTGRGSFFTVGLKNISDEFLQAKANIHGTLEISSPTDPSFHRKFDFVVPQFDGVTINPVSEFTVTVAWDQRDDSCRYVFRNLSLESYTIGHTTYLRTTQMLTFRAKGKVQFWPNVQTKELPEIAINHRYYFLGFDPRPDFMNSRSCRQFPITP